ncbi:MAG TPA: hemin uptake protein HemP [Methylophilus sp.]|uniref:hemin uptake protein HemP n=1 Tax=Methylophilus sp. TaxID=29541 RepID=UPI002BBF1F79|nr:hemin uptake protein HemP [Methylophilus sp.]HSH87011.1 hemin uptake protein HemP [Methylophilus sp.]
MQPLSGKNSSLVEVSGMPLAVIDARQLFGNASGVVIMHGNETYKLTRTKQNKLLLTKCHNEVVDVSSGLRHI